MSRLLVIRNSSMGDVALTLPAVKSALIAYPDLQLTFVSQQKFKPFFYGIERLEFFVADLKGDHKGFLGIYRLFKALQSKYRYDAVLDLHSVWRSWLLSLFFIFLGIPVYGIDKGRDQKKALARKKGKIVSKLKPAYQRYADVFEKAGFPLTLDFSENNWIQTPQNPLKTNLEVRVKTIGVAPFAQHKTKMWPLKKSEELIRILTDKGWKVYLFGGGADEEKLLAEMEKKNPRSISLAGKFSLQQEMAIMKNLDLMVTMDSSNLHIASLLNLPVVSIWGGTHSFAGFAPIGKNQESMIEINRDDLGCRPCSIYGKESCFRGDLACLNWLKVEQVLQRIEVIYSQKKEDCL